MILREDFFGPRKDQHAPGCSLADVREYYPRNEEELNTLRKAITGWEPPPLDSVPCPCGYDSTTTPGCGGPECTHKKDGDM